MTERQYLAHRLHQYRVEARLTIAEAAANAGITERAWFAIEYENASTAAKIKRLIAMFAPGERRMQCIQAKGESR